MATGGGPALWKEGPCGGSKEGLGSGEHIERGRDIPVGRAGLLQEEAEELGGWGAGQTTVRNLMETEAQYQL